jgi:putative transcriptional regulator
LKKRQWLIDIRGSKTQEDIAKEAKIARSYYAQIEVGARNPSVTMAKKIAAALSFDWTIFFEETGCETQPDMEAI